MNKIVKTDSVNTIKPGTYSVRFNAIDANGNLAVEVIRTVIVVDTTPPIIVLNGTKEMTHSAGTIFGDLGVVATDIVDGDVTKIVNVTGKVNNMVPGDYYLVYSVEDSAGNRAQEEMRLVRVIDDERPEITLIGEAVQIIEAGTEYLDSGALANDLIDGDLTDSIN